MLTTTAVKLRTRLSVVSQAAMRGWVESAVSSLRTNASLTSREGRSTVIGSAPSALCGAVAAGAAGAGTLTETGADGRRPSITYASQPTSPTITITATIIHGLRGDG